MHACPVPAAGPACMPPAPAPPGSHACAPAHACRTPCPLAPPHRHPRPREQDLRAAFAGSRATFLGALRGAELAAAYASADMFVLPSQTETLGNVVGEVSRPAGPASRRAPARTRAMGIGARRRAGLGGCRQSRWLGPASTRAAPQRCSPARLPALPVARLAPPRPHHAHQAQHTHPAPAAAQAMASGLPEVAARACGVPTFVRRPGETGVLFPRGGAEAAAAAVRGLAADPRARQRMGAAARAEMERCSWRAATRELLQRMYPAALAAAAAAEARTRRSQASSWLLAGAAVAGAVPVV